MATVALSGIITPTNVVTATSTTTLTNKTLTGAVMNGTLGATTPSTVIATTVKASTTMGVGAATPSASGAGITFPATQSASSDANTLDDYEEGTWTPSLGGTTTYTAQRGEYTKIGRVVYVTGVLVINVLGTGSTTIVSGLPFTSLISSTNGFPVSYFSGVSTNVVSIYGYVNDNATTFLFYSLTAAGATTAANAIFANGTQINFSGAFIV